MQSTKLSAAVVLVAVAAAAALFVVLRDDDGGAEPQPTTTTTVAEEPPAGPGEEGPGADRRPERAEPELPTIVVRDGRPVDGVANLSFRSGDRVEFAIRSDADDEIHVHGYDIYRDVEGGSRTRVGFPADIEGVFEVELHDASAEIARIAIRP